MSHEGHTMLIVKTTTLKSSLCGYSDACIRVKGKITIRGAGDDAAARQADERDKGVDLEIMLYSPFVLARSVIPN